MNTSILNNLKKMMSYMLKIIKHISTTKSTLDPNSLLNLDILTLLKMDGRILNNRLILDSKNLLYLNSLNLLKIDQEIL